MDDSPDRDDTRGSPSMRTIAMFVGMIALFSLGGLTLLGGQVTSILSNVGNSIGVVGSAPGDRDTTGSSDANGSSVETDPDGKGNPIVDTAATGAELLIIRTGQLELEVADVEGAAAIARTRVAAVGGYVSSSEESAAGTDPTATVTFRIPADRWEDALTALREVAAEVRHLEVETQAVTNQVVDLSARIANLRTTEAALQAIMAQAVKIPEVLEVQGKLTEVRGEIERLTAQKVNLEGQAAFGTLAVAFVLPVTPVVDEVRAGWDPAADADAATGALIGLGQRLASFGIWVAIVGLPTLFVVVVVVGVLVISRRMSRHLQAGGGES